MRYTKKEYFKQMNMEQQFYDHSLRARILQYDSYFLSRYFYHLRMIEWYELAPPIHIFCGIKSWWDGINLDCVSMGV